MAKSKGLTCPLCGGVDFARVKLLGEWKCGSGGGGWGQPPITVRFSNPDAPKYDDREVDLKNSVQACLTCGFIIHRANVNSLKSAEENRKKDSATKKKKEAKKAAEKRAKNKAKKEAQANETTELEKKIADAVAAEDYKAAAELKEKLGERQRDWALGYD